MTTAILTETHRPETTLAPPPPQVRGITSVDVETASPVWRTV